MAFKHGIYVEEVETAIQPMLSLDSPVVVIGTAPAQSAEVANTPQICYSLNEFKEKFGFSTDWDNYTLCEAAYCFFTLYRINPVIFINALDISKHKASATKSVTVFRNIATVAAQIVLSSLVVKSGETTLRKDTDYTAAYNNSGNLEIKIKSANKVTNNTLALTFDELKPSQVTKADIIAAIEGVEAVYPKFQMNTSIIIAPKWSCDAEVAAVMAAACLDINTCFKAVTFVDIPTDTVTTYDACNEYKNSNNLVDENMYLCWPKVSLGGKQYHLSTQAAALTCRVDAENGDVPYESPSNKNLQCDSAVLANGTEVLLGKGQADYLNSVGIATALNFAGGWKLWGNCCSIYPNQLDPKDYWLPLRKMLAWVSNTLITSFFHKVDKPINRRLVQNIVNSVNIWLNSLAAREFILGGRVEFLREENADTDLIAGKLTLHVYIGFVTPAQEINFLVEYDTSYLETLFS